MSLLGYDAMALGNHEFDFGVASFVKNFVGNITDNGGNIAFPILGCNIKPGNEAAFKKVYQNSTIIIKDGVKIGIVGYITELTKLMGSKIGTIEFLDVVDSVKEESNRLRSQGCQFIIGLGHIGLENDKELARQSDLDLIIGGHSHSLLWSNDSNSAIDPDDIGKVAGTYPTFEKNIEGRTVPILQASWAGKYLGAIHLQLHSEGE